jgi:hypothetical protein
MGRFYETTFYDTSVESTLLGWQVLSSPPEINGEPIPYRELLDDLEMVKELNHLGELDGLEDALALLGDPTSIWGTPMTSSGLWTTSPPKLPSGYMDSLMEAPFVAAETSPLGARSIAELAGMASTTVVVVLNGMPAIILIGEALGLIVIRGLSAVSGALWDGARDEVQEFGGDVAASLLDRVRSRLGIRRRYKR